MNRRPLALSALLFFGALSSSLFAIDQKTIQDRAQLLQKLSTVERDRLDRNIEAFQKLDDAQKQRYRELHAKLAEDRAQAGRLTTVLQTYSVWVETLTPTQRDELQREADLSRKLALIKRFKEEQDLPFELPEASAAHPDEPIPVPVTQVNPRNALEPRDLAAVMKVIVASLPAERMKPEFSQPKLSDYLSIVLASAQSYSSFGEWPDDALLQKMLAALSKEPQQIVKKSESKRDAIIRVILLGIKKQLIQSVHLPTAEEKLQTLQSMTLVERERIMKLPKERMMPFVTRKYFESQGEDALNAYKSIPEYQRQLGEMFDRLEVARPPGVQRQRPGPRAQRDPGNK